MIDSIDYDSIVKFINLEIIQNKLYVQAGGVENMVIGLKEIISDKIWIENTIQTISDGLQKLNPLMFMTAKNLISSNELPDPFVHGSLDNNKTYTKELIVLLLIGGYLLYTNQDNQELQFYVYFTISLLVGFYIIINKTTILDATESILFTANDFIRSIIPGLKSEFEIELEKNVKIFEEINKPFRRLNNVINKIYDESAIKKRELTDDEKEIIDNEENINEEIINEEKIIDKKLDKIKKIINNHKVNSYEEYKKIKPIIIFNCKKVLRKMKVIFLVSLKIIYTSINPNEEKYKQLIDKYYKYIDNLSWDELTKKSYNFLTNPIEETYPFEEINQLTKSNFDKKTSELNEELIQTLKWCFKLSEYFVLVIYNIKIYNKFNKPRIDLIFNYLFNKINYNKNELEKNLNKNLGFFLRLDQTEELIKIYIKFIENIKKNNQYNNLLLIWNNYYGPIDGAKYETLAKNLPVDLEIYIDKVKNENSLLVGGSLLAKANKPALLGSFKEILFLKAPENILQFITWIVLYPLDQVKHLFFTSGSSNIKNKVQTSEKSDSKYLYSIENDKIRLFEKNSDGSQGNEIQSVQMAIRNELEGNYQAARDARNKVCEKLFGVNESNPICAKHFYTILGKSGLGMLHNLAEPTKKDHIYSALINAEPNIKYEILKNLGWKMKVLRNDKQIVNVDEWLETLGQDLRSEYEKYFKNYSHVKIILNKMIQDLNNNTKILDQKYNQLVNTPKPLVRKKRLTSAQIAMLRKLETSI